MKNSPRNKKMNLIADAIEKQTGVSIEAIRSKSKIREFVIARQYFAKLAYEHNYTLSRIGKFINRSHPEILHLKRIFSRDYKENKMNFALDFEKIKTNFYKKLLEC